MAEIASSEQKTEATVTPEPTSPQPSKASAQSRLDQWSRKHRIPFVVKCVRTKQNTSSIDTWTASLFVQNKEDCLVAKTAPTKAEAQEQAADAFFSQGTDSVLLKILQPLPANSLKELCDLLCLPPFVVRTMTLTAGQLQISEQTFLVAEAKRQAQEGRTETRTKLKLKKVARQFESAMEQHKEWTQCTITHSLWTEGVKVHAAAPSNAQARRACEVRVLEKCMKDPGMFGHLPTPTSKSCKPVTEVVKEMHLFGVEPQSVADFGIEFRVLPHEDLFGGHGTKAFEYLARQTPIAVDCRVSAHDDSKEGAQICTLQLFGGCLALVCQVRKCCETKTWPKALQSLLGDAHIKKFAVAFKGKHDMLSEAGLDVCNYDDLQTLAYGTRCFNEKATLPMMAARFNRISLVKDEAMRKSNWAAEKLTPEQIDDAVADVVVIFLVAIALNRYLQAKAQGKGDVFYLPWMTAKSKPKGKDKPKKPSETKKA